MAGFFLRIVCVRDIIALEVISMESPTEWDNDFDKQYYTPEEIAESDAVAARITDEIEHGHGALLPFERSAVDA